MIELNIFKWFCHKDNLPYVVTSKGVYLSDAFEMLPIYRQKEAVHQLKYITRNGVRL